MLFRNQAMKYMNAAPDDGAAGGGGVPGANTGEVVPTFGPGAEKAAKDATDKAAADEKAAKEAAEAAKKAEEGKSKEPDKAPAAAGSIDSYIEQFSAEKPALALALGFLKDAGINTTDPAFQLAESSNDFTLLEAILSQKGLAGTDQMVAILKAEAAANAAAVEAEQKATDELVHSILGDSTGEILDWAVKNAEPDEAAAIDDLLNRGGVYARAAAVMIQQAYYQSGNTVPSKASPPTKAAPSTTNGPVTASQFSAESQKLYAKYGPDFRQTQEYAKLSSARAAARAKGL